MKLGAAMPEVDTQMADTFLSKKVESVEIPGADIITSL